MKQVSQPSNKFRRRTTQPPCSAPSLPGSPTTSVCVHCDAMPWQVKFSLPPSSRPVGLVSLSRVAPLRLPKFPGLPAFPGSSSVRGFGCLWVQRTYSQDGPECGGSRSPRLEQGHGQWLWGVLTWLLRSCAGAPMGTGGPHLAADGTQVWVTQPGRLEDTGGGQ